MSVNKNPLRHGNFTSSEIVALTAKDKSGKNLGKPALTYIKEKNMERLLGRSLTTESSGKPILWGKLLEQRAFEQLGLEYTLCSDETVIHPTIPYWAGTRDGYKNLFETVADLKCPYTLKSFCTLVQPLYEGLSGMEAINFIRDEHSEGEKYYWQLVSGACLTNPSATHGELIVYMPYESELAEIKMLAEGNAQYYWLNFAQDDDLPYILDGGYYKNINIIRFEIPQHDKDFLTECVKKAGEMLLGNKVLKAA